MKIQVFFETPNGSAAELVAEFFSEETLAKCMPALEKDARDNRYIVTTSVVYSEQLEEVNTSEFSPELLQRIHDLESYTIEVEVDADFSYTYTSGEVTIFFRGYVLTKTYNLTIVPILIEHARCYYDELDSEHRNLTC